MSRTNRLFSGVFLLLFVFLVCMPAAEAVPKPFGSEVEPGRSRSRRTMSALLIKVK
jgi:hypothetical protein